MKLYYSPGSCSLAPHIIVNELGIKCEFERVNLKEGTYSGGDFKSINSQGSVPVLEMEEGGILSEVSVIMQYLCSLKPDHKILPKSGTLEYFRVLEWLNFIATELHKGFAPLWYPSTPDNYKMVALENLKKKFDHVVTKLENRPYLMGHDFSAPDAYLYTVLRWTRPLRIDLTLYPTLSAYLTRLTERPAIQKSLETEQ